jgi:hypothetical protein
VREQHGAIFEPLSLGKIAEVCVQDVPRLGLIIVFFPPLARSNGNQHHYMHTRMVDTYSYLLSFICVCECAFQTMHVCFRATGIHASRACIHAYDT